MQVCSKIVLNSRLFKKILSHARAVVPREAVGFIGGKADGRATTIIPLNNIGGSHSFFVDPVSQYYAEQQLLRDRLTIIAIYHSHPGGGVQLSPADIMFGAAWECLHVVVVPERPDSASNVIQAWSINGTNARPAEIVHL